MSSRTRVIAVLIAMASVLSGCGSAEPATEPDPVPVVESPSESPAAGSRLAPGLYELEGGTVQALGTLEWVDLEGGFWAIKGGTESEGNVGVTVAVIANGSELQSQLEPLAGKTVMVTGTRLEGASVRMAGPEIEASEVTEVSDTVDPAQ